jgi:hypothetical protein
MLNKKNLVGLAFLWVVSAAIILGLLYSLHQPPSSKTVTASFAPVPQNAAPPPQQPQPPAYNWQGNTGLAAPAPYCRALQQQLAYQVNNHDYDDASATQQEIYNNNCETVPNRPLPGVCSQLQQQLSYERGNGEVLDADKTQQTIFSKGCD